MAIGSLSFCGVNNSKTPYRTTGSRTTSNTRSSSYNTRTSNTYEDSFTRTSNTAQRTNRKKKTGCNPLVKTTAKVLIPVMIYAGGVQMGKKAQMDDYLEAPYGIVINAEQSYEELAEANDIPLDVMLWANEADNAQTVPKKAIIPTEYDFTKEKRAELEEKIASKKTSAEDMAKYEKELEALNIKKELQDELATVYINEDEKALIIPNGYVSCEDVKEAFGIKDGVIKKYNGDKLGFTWGVDDFEGRGYKDYTGANVPRSGIEIPLDKING